MATFQKTLKKHIFLHPVDKKRRHAAVRATLLEDKKKYSDKLEGALLDVKNLKIAGDRHLIVDGYLSMEVIGDFQVFCPQPGQVLEGVINKRSQGHLGCLVMDTFNAALTVPSDSDLDPQVGDLCTFAVREVVVDGEILFMRGTLVSVEKNPNAPVLNTSDFVSNKSAGMGVKINFDDGTDIEEDSIDIPTKTEVSVKQEPAEVTIKEEPVETEDISKKKKRRKMKKRKSEETNHKKLKSPKKELT